MTANEPTPILGDSITKREKIIKLLYQGTHTTKNIAKMANTTEAYVWKEKSRLKMSGHLVRHDKEIISKTRQINIFSTNNSLLSVPQVDPEGVRTIYREFGLGRTPPQIISEYGFHPELVEIEYQRFLRFEKEYDIYTLERKFFQNYEKDLLNANNYTVNSLVQKYKKDGKLGADEFISLINVILNEKYRVGKISAIYDLINNIPPAGWQAARCMNCYEPLSGCMEDPENKLRITVTNTFQPVTHNTPCKH